MRGRLGSLSVVGRPVPSQPLLPDHLKRVVTQIQGTAHMFPSNVQGKENSPEEGTALKDSYHLGLIYLYFQMKAWSQTFVLHCFYFFLYDI